MHDVLLDLVPGAAAATAASERAVDLPRLGPHPFGPGELGDRPRRRRDVLAVGDLDRRQPQDLVAEARGGALEIGQLLGRQQDADAGLASTRYQRQQVVGAERRELVDRDRRRQSLPGRLQAMAGRADDVLDRERAELRGELSVDARVEAEDDHVASFERRPQVDRLAGRAGHQVAPGVRFADDRQPRSEPADGADLVGGQPGDVVLDPLTQGRIDAADGGRQASRLHQRHDVGDRRLAAVGMQDLEGRLDVALRGSLIVGFGEALGCDQLVLELGRVAARERVPVARAIRGPDPDRPSGDPGRALELVRERRRALQVDRDHRQSARYPVAEDPQQGGRLPGAARADDQAMGG